MEGTDLVLEARAGEDLLEVLQRGGCDVATACGGIAACGFCRILVVSGQDALSAPRSQEKVHVDQDGARLACQTKVRAPGDVVVRVVEHAEPE